MNEIIYIVEVKFLRSFVCLFFFGKKEERMLKQKDDISDGLSEATGIYQKCLSNIHTEFLVMIKIFYH